MKECAAYLSRQPYHQMSPDDKAEYGGFLQSVQHSKKTDAGAKLELDFSIDNVFESYRITR